MCVISSVQTFDLKLGFIKRVERKYTPYHYTYNMTSLMSKLLLRMGRTRTS